MTDSPTPTEAADLAKRLEDRASAYGPVLGCFGVYTADNAQTDRTAAVMILSQEAELNTANGLIERLRREAEQWAMEARGHKASLHEAYQAVTGATGEPGNWNGAVPIIEAIAKEKGLRLSAETALREAREALEPFARVAPLVEFTDKRDGNVVHRQWSTETGYVELTKDDFRRVLALTLKQGGQDQGEARARPSAGLDRDHFPDVGQLVDMAMEALGTEGLVDPDWVEARPCAERIVKAFLALAPTDRVTKRDVDLAKETLAGHPQGKEMPDLALAWLANRAELHARAVLRALPSEERGSGQ